MYSRNVPCAHGGTENDYRHRTYRDDNGVPHRRKKVCLLHALDKVLNSEEGTVIRQCKRISRDESFFL